MVRWIILLMVVIPAVEIYALIMVGRWIGGWPTVGIVVFTGILGAYLAKREAKKVWYYARGQMAIGQVPARSILDAICIFTGGALLVIPGFFSDILGLLLLIPGTRAFFAAWLLFLIQKKIGRRTLRG